MLVFGLPPYLECSSKGFKPFSSFHARIYRREGKSIEEIYQSSKIFPEEQNKLRWQADKGLEPLNKKECRDLYSKLWDEYFEENPEYIDILKFYNGFTDIFGQEGHACQAEEIYRIAFEYYDTNVEKDFLTGNTILRRRR